LKQQLKGTASSPVPCTLQYPALYPYPALYSTLDSTRTLHSTKLTLTSSSDAVSFLHFLLRLWLKQKTNSHNTSRLQRKKSIHKINKVWIVVLPRCQSQHVILRPYQT